MGKVTTNIKLRNFNDTTATPLELNNVIVDSGATLLCLSPRLIQQLNLTRIHSVKVNTSMGVEQLSTYGAVELEIEQRKGIFEVMELKHPKIEALVGQIPLERLDFLIHPGINRLIPNPEHDNQLILDQLVLDLW
ncbi:hypothetical protein D5085_01010 [Ectothiorhodospiraceae bacterium BW-2]|nr:hypothetical protein D5085_01010 [Ectothiorhodospiraceae bacterium BW-2]